MAEALKGFIDNLKALYLGRKAGRGKLIGAMDVSDAEALAKNPRTEGTLVEAAAKTHWSNPDSPSGGMPPDEPLAPKVSPPSTPQSKP